MDPGLGARLRAQREQQQIALSAISDDTKIKLSMLEGLERDDVSQWPEGIYRRAYVRAYARAIGLDAETLVREFLEVHPDPVVTQSRTDTELEDPPWPAGFRRFVTAAMAAGASQHHALETGRPEALQAKLNLPGKSDDSPADDDRVASSSEVSSVAGGERGRRQELSLMAAAELCTRLGCVVDSREVPPILQDAAMALDAVGLVVWSWDLRTATLRPSFAYGYEGAPPAQMPSVRADADNAIAAAFRSARACVITGGDGVTGAVVVPLLSHTGCVGVLAVELQHGDEQRESVCAFATILAAYFVALIGSAPLAEAVNA